MFLANSRYAGVAQDAVTVRGVARDRRPRCAGCPRWTATRTVVSRHDRLDVIADRMYGDRDAVLARRRRQHRARGEHARRDVRTASSRCRAQ